MSVGFFLELLATTLYFDYFLPTNEFLLFLEAFQTNTSIIDFEKRHRNNEGIFVSPQILLVPLQFLPYIWHVFLMTCCSLFLKQLVTEKNSRCFLFSTSICPARIRENLSTGIVSYKTSYLQDGLALQFFSLDFKIFVSTKFVTADSTARLVVNVICHSCRRFPFTGLDKFIWNF